MSVRIRLLTSFAIVTALLLLPVLFAAQRLAELRDLAVEGRGRHAAAVLAVGHLQTDLAELDRDERSYLVTGAPELRASVEDEIGRLRLELDSLRASPYAKPAAGVAPIVDSIVDLTATIHTLMEKGRIGEATAEFARVEPLLVDGRQRVRALAGAIDRIAQADFRRAEAISASARQSTLAGVAFFVLVAILVGAWTTYALVRPLGRLAEATARVAGGRLEDPPDLPYHRKDEIGALSQSFRAMTRRLSELDRMKAEFVGVASHELKTPINVINGYTELIEEETLGGLTEHQHQILDGILEQTRAMSRLVSRLMDISRLEAGTYRMEFDVVHVEDLVTGLLRSFDVLARAKRVAFQARIDQSAPETLVLDVDIVRDEVLGNLVSNALTHTPEGGWIEVEVWGEGDEVVFRVADSGPGIPEEHHAHIFDKYYQVERSRAVGTGLGLAIAREMVDAHGGRIWVEPRVEGRGADFRVALPRANVGASSPAVPVPPN